MRQRDRRRRREPGEIGRLQIPVQRLLEPEHVVRLDPVGEIDAVGQVVGRVHVEQQIGSRRRSRGAPRRPAPPPARGDAGAGLQLDRAVAESTKARQLPAVIGVGRALPVIAAGRIGEERPVLAAEQPVDRHPGRLALQIPQRDVDAGDRRHDLGALAARGRRRDRRIGVARVRIAPGRGVVSANIRSHTALVRQRVHARDRPRRSASPIRRSAASASRGSSP